MPNLFWSVLLVTLFLAVSFGCLMLSTLFLKRGVLSVIRIFQEHDAIGECNAKTFSELGIRPKVFADYFYPGLRDYKKEALRLLMVNNIVRKTVDNRLYLIEDYPV